MKKIWIFLRLLSGSAALYFLVQFSCKYWNYTHLNRMTAVSVENWKILEKGSSKFALSADYVYLVGEKEYRSTFVLAKPYFLNRIAAEKEIKKKSNLSWRAWYCQQKPEKSALQKQFPLKIFFNFLVTLGIALYFALSRSSSMV